ncbi:hypothetical protein JYU34_006318 [Plutella xylostella]|uniref:Reverse transcriptase domain-containing protein n=1 Tax=Plutella xylostella TaxID=51655 RepID=A0ABQ7QRR4_PLUXY|nr:hypothetical protein JYU34_006318 [Plutella xylostella]
MDISEALDSKQETHAIYTDFSKAFDLVNHSLLLYKLSIFGIHGSLLQWCRSYLENRTQLVLIRGFKSDPREVPSGVPQGSHLGPLFFVMFINDLVVGLRSKFKLFADDVKLYRAVRNHEDTQLLQADINLVQEWCHRNHMTLNASKCFHISFTRKKIPLTAKYRINNTPLEEVETIRDLGIIMDKTLSFRDHIDITIKKASKLAGFVTRQTKIFRDSSLAITMFNSLVRSILEYSSPVWNPSYKIHVNRLERVQKRFLYHLAYTENKCRSLESYSDRRKHYKLQSLEARRRCNDIIFLTKTVQGKVDSPEILGKIKLNIPRSGSRLQNRKTFYLPTCTTLHAQHSPLYRLLATYNSVQDSIDIFGSTVSSIKYQLKSFIM